MSRFKILFLTAALIGSQWAVAPSAEAGPLLDWLRGLRNRRNCNTCYQGCQAPATTLRQTQYTGTVNPYNLQPGQCARTCNQTCSRTVVNYVPCTAYRTSWKQVPVTQYKPQTSSDPCTGCTVTCMRPCTSYTWQMQRVPYTTYRPVYTQQNYTVPVTTITNDCATGTCGTCATCPPATGVSGGTILPGQSVLPQSSSSVVAPNGTIGTNGSYQTAIPPYDSGSAVPAETTPILDPSVNPQNSQRPTLIDRIETLPMGSSGKSIDYRANAQPSSPAVISFDQTAQSPVRKKWDYSVQLASYTSLGDESILKQASHTSTGPFQIRGTFQGASSSQAQPTNVNSAWNTVEW